MTSGRYREFCQRLADLFIGGDPMDMTRFYSYPLAIYVNDSVQVEHSPEDTVRAVSSRRSQARERGAVRVAIDVLSVDRSEDGRMRVRVAWTYIDARDQPVEASLLVYYCTETPDDGIRIGMIQFESMAFPDTPYSTASEHGPH